MYIFRQYMAQVEKQVVSYYSFVRHSKHSYDIVSIREFKKINTTMRLIMTIQKTLNL